MAYTFKDFDERANDITSWLFREYTGIRTGRATPMLLDIVQVESYGARVPINQVGSVNVEDARTLRIGVWDQSQIKNVEKALTEADLGVSVISDSSGLRIIFPELTSERRVQLLKIAKAKLEDSRVSLRGARDDTMKSIEAEQKAGSLSEDDRYKAKEDLQKRMDTINNKLQDLYDLKETEINQ